MWIQRSLPVALLLVAAVAAPLAADCGDDPTNLFSTENCDFDSGIAGWAASTGLAFWEMTDGDPEAGSLEGLLNSAPLEAVLGGRLIGAY